MQVPPLVDLANRAELSADNHRLWKAYYAGELDELLAIPVIRKYYLAVKADKKLRRAIEKHDLKAIIHSDYFARAINDDQLADVVAARWREIRSHVSDRQIVEAKAQVAKLDARSRARFDRLMRRAREHGVADPWAAVKGQASAQTNSGG